MRIERDLLIGFAIAFVGATLFVFTLIHWASTNFGDLPIVLAIRYTIPSVILMTVGSQITATTLFLRSLELFMPIPDETDDSRPVADRAARE